jgi:small-conductance mechanosensitive channel
VALTGLLLLLLSPGGTALAQAEEAPEEAPQAQAPPKPKPKPEEVAQETQREARRAVEELQALLLSNLPKLAVAALFLFAAWVLVRILRPLLRRVLRGWERSAAITALVGIGIWLLAFGGAVSVLAEDVRALVGSLGLVGLALSWALQTPIESFTGWLLNSFQRYYRVGDRIAVGEVFGDVHRIDFLTTMVWEIGSPDRPGFVNAEQPTGRLITFPNNEVLNGTVMNYTRDFPYVWDELALPIANESDLPYAMQLVHRVALGVLGEAMAGPAQQYEEILRKAHLESSVAPQPEVFASLAESWVDLSIRYLVPARERRKWKSELVVRMMAETSRPEHLGRIIPALPRRQVQFIGTDGTAREFGQEG